ncbi:lipopolysaccharide biosynthesis protein, partial [Candidatus Sumerlaeota bacterium]|nr:lipopolysaccharide biosynthesis protein [Candidatus Sumerlaeota bacterium]
MNLRSRGYYARAGEGGHLSSREGFMDKFRSKTLSGLLWTSGGQFARQLLSFGVWVGFARLLTQKEFGVNNMITVLEGFLEIAAELGLGAALIQRSALRQEHLASAFWATLATGLGAMILFAACGPIFSSFYREPSLVALSLFVAFSLPAGTLKVVQYSILSREMKFRTLAVAEITALVISGGISLTLAFWGFGVWSLAASFVINDVMFTLLLWLASPWRPSLQFDRAALKELLLFGVPMTGTQMIGHTAISIDSVLVGRFFGPAPLGLYTLALSIVVVPVNNVFQVVNRVIFPAFSLIQEDKARIKELYLKFSGAIMLLVAPVYLGLAVTAGPAVQFIFGEKWIEAVPILQVFCLRGLLGLVGGMNTNLFLSQGRADLRLRVIFFFRFLTIVAVFVGLYWSVMGVAWG